MSRLLFALRSVMYLLFMFYSLVTYAESNNDYKLSAGDLIKIVVFQNPELTTEARVPESGIINFPLIGNVMLGGTTIRKAEQEIASALSAGGFIKSPQINIVLTQIVGNRVAVFGLVNKPGWYPLDRFDTKLSEMVASAGGVQLTAGYGTAHWSGIRNGVKSHEEIDLADLILNHNDSKDLLISSGDAIYVYPGNQVSVIGMVNKPGKYTLDKMKMSVPEVIALAGGIQPIGASDIVIIKGERAEKPFTKTVDLSERFTNDKEAAEEFLVQSGDEVYVHRAPMFYIYGEAQRPGAYRVEHGMVVLQALALGGGPTVRGTQRNIKIYRKTAKGEIEKTTPQLTDEVKENDILFVEESLF